MSFTPEQIARFGIIPHTETDLFNAQSAEAQIACGVDPADCMRIGRTIGGGPTPRELFLGSLHERIWLTPTDGNWPVDDTNNHWDTVRSMPPQGALLVVRSAEIGLEFVGKGLIAEADNAVGIVHRFLSVWGKRNHFDELVEYSRVAKPISFDELEAYRWQLRAQLDKLKNKAA